MITGVVAVDIRDVDCESARSMVWSQVSDAPRGIRVVLMVGTKPVDPPVVDIFREHVPGLDVEVQGSVRAVRLWVIALRVGTDL